MTGDNTHLGSSETNLTDSHQNAKETSKNMDSNPMVDKISKNAHDTIDQLSETAVDKINNAKETLSQFSENFQAKAHQFKNKRDELAERLSAPIKRKPLSAIAIAFLAGALMTHICHRHR